MSRELKLALMGLNPLTGNAGDIRKSLPIEQ
jgi:hypothetical protein